MHGGSQPEVRGEGDGHQTRVSVEGRHVRESIDVKQNPELLVVVNGHASGSGDPGRTAAEVVAVLRELGARATAKVTYSEEELWSELRAAIDSGRRLALVGGDGSLHAAANAPLATLPELALVPAGRANNIAHALGISVDRPRAARVAAFGHVRNFDALAVRTPERTLYAVEAVSAGFHAEARSAYSGENSSDLRQGLRAFIGALRRYRPNGVRACVDGTELASTCAAQLFLSNLRCFGFGFEVDPESDPADGRLEAILLEAPNRRTLLRLLAATYRGHHLSRPGVRRISGRSAELTAPVPLVADAFPLGTTTATVSVEPGRIPLAVPARRTRPGGPG